MIVWPAAATGCAIGQRIKDEANQRRAERAAERERMARERKSEGEQVYHTHGDTHP